MTEQFGYRHTPLPSYVARYQDYLVGRYPNYEASEWDNLDKVNIRTLWAEIQLASDEETEALVELWRRIEVMLEAVKERLQTNALVLQERWSSPAGEEFLRRVGAALYSLEEWREAAANNKARMAGVAEAISRAQDQMLPIWERYVAEDNEMADRRQFERNDSVWSSVVHGFKDNPLSYEEVLQKYTDEAKPIMRGLADTYIDSAIELDRGIAYQGPKSASTPIMDTTAFGPPGRPNLSGVPIPNLPGAPALPNPALPNPNLPDPNLPGSGPQFAGVAAPPAPSLTPPPPSLPPGGPVAPPAVGPVVPAPPGLPVQPGPARPPMAPRPSGTPAHPGSPGTPGSPRQPLQGSSARTGVPGLPGRPNLRGASQRTAPGQAPGPAAPASMGPRKSGQPMPPPLGGRRGALANDPQAKARARGTGPAPGGAAPAPAGSPLAGRRSPGSAPTKRIPSVHGVTRALAGGTARPAPARSGGPPPGGLAPGSRLDGRRHRIDEQGSRPVVPPARRGRRRPDKEESRTSPGVDERVLNEESASALSPPPEPPPPPPDRAIGRQR